MKAEPLLSCEGVTKMYGGLVALNDVSFTVARGDIRAIVGPNGAGKTTLFEVIAGSTKPSSGSVRLNGQEIQDFGPDEICRMGLARTFQTTVSFDSQTVLNNALIGSIFGSRRVRTFPIRWDRGAAQSALKALDRCGLASLASKPAAVLSVFEKKRLMLASAIASGSEVLLLDEPVSGLNVEERGRLTELIRELNAEGMTILMIEHVMKAVTDLAGSVLVLHHGVKILDGPPAEVMADTTMLEVYLGGSIAQGATAEGIADA